MGDAGLLELCQLALDDVQAGEIEIAGRVADPCPDPRRSNTIILWKELFDQWREEARAEPYEA